jgi:putative ABC transport system permease protein
MDTRPTTNSLWAENVKQAMDIIRSHRMRSGLLILGVAIGITTILAMVTVMSGLVRKINKDLESASKPYLFVTRYDFFVSGEDEEEMLRRKKLEFADTEALRRESESLDKVCYFVTVNDMAFILYYKGESTPPLELDGADYTFPEIFSLPIEHGRYYTAREVLHRERVVVLGYGPAKDLFGSENPIGKHASIDGKKYRVIGTFANREHFIGSISNNFAVIPYTAYHKDFQTDRDDPSIAANVKDGYALEDGLEEVRNILRVRRNVEAGKEDDFYVTTSTAFIEMVGKITMAISAVLVVIASIGLLVGGIGVMNIMLISVAERTREIGVRMALGANKRDIIQQFLTESATLTGLGGVAGTLFGLVAAWLITRLINFPFHFSLPWTIVALVFSALIGIIFGIYPARRAAKLDPVDALRYE